jgi:hypothetical protein
MLNHRYDYQTNLEASLRINWRIEDVIGGRQFDYGKPFLPDSLAGVTGIRCLNAKEKLTLNHIRGYTYLYMFGLVEEYILPSVVDHAETTVHGLGVSRIPAMQTTAHCRMAGGFKGAGTHEILHRRQRQTWNLVSSIASACRHCRACDRAHSRLRFQSLKQR